LDSNATISKEHSLLDQGGSRVIKGNLLTVPIAGSMLYVEPWYVQASGGQTSPVLRKFLAYSGGNAGFQKTLNAAIDEVFGVKGSQPTPVTPTQPSQPTTSPPTSSELRAAIAAAQRDEAAAEGALRRGDFAEYGRRQAALRR